MFIATDGGPHSADKLAGWAAKQIGDLIQIDDNSTSAQAVAARKQKPRLILDIADAIEEHHAEVQAAERELLATKGTARLSNSLDPRMDHLDALNNATAAVVACAKGTIFEPGFKGDQIKTAIKGIIGSWFATAIDIERDWVAKGHTVGEDGRAEPNPDHKHRDAHVLAWHARRSGKAA